MHRATHSITKHHTQNKKKVGKIEAENTDAGNARLLELEYEHQKQQLMLESQQQNNLGKNFNYSSHQSDEMGEMARSVVEISANTAGKSGNKVEESLEMELQNAE